MGRLSALHRPTDTARPRQRGDRIEPQIAAVHMAAIGTSRQIPKLWDSNAAPIGPQGKLIDEMSASAREELRARLRRRLPVTLDGRIVYESFANAVKGRVV